MSELKQDDVVALVNNHDFDCVFKFDSNDYTVKANKQILVKRFIADHGVRKTRKKVGDDYIYPLSIEEIENPTMANGQVSVSNQKEVDDLKEKLAKLEAENKALKSGDRVEDYGVSVEEKRGPGRPRGR